MVVVVEVWEEGKGKIKVKKGRNCVDGKIEWKKMEEEGKMRGEKRKGKQTEEKR